MLPIGQSLSPAQNDDEDDAMYFSCGEADNPSRDKFIFLLSVKVQTKAKYVQRNVVAYAVWAMISYPRSYQTSEAV